VKKVRIKGIRGCGCHTVEYTGQASPK
jgi:hypothetical protein